MDGGRRRIRFEQAETTFFAPVQKSGQREGQEANRCGDVQAATAHHISIVEPIVERALESIKPFVAGNPRSGRSGCNRSCSFAMTENFDRSIQRRCV